MIDRFYFRSIYFREPSGVLFEIATLGPGFATDEDAEHLGERLSLPPAFEHLREQIEPVLTPLPDPRAALALSDRRAATRERPAAGEPEGALVLLHGRGADEHDLFPLLDALDPERRLLGVTPRGPLSLPPGGAHWYGSAGSRRPTRRRSCRRFERVGAGSTSCRTRLPSRVVLGGFSQGTAMTWALGLGRGPAGARRRSSRCPASCRRSTASSSTSSGLDGYPVAIGHGSLDPVIPVDWGRDGAPDARGRRRGRPLPRVPAPAHDRPALPPRALRSFVAAAVAAK